MNKREEYNEFDQVYDNLPNKCERKRNYISRNMQKSKSQVDRYSFFNHLLPELQEMVQNGMIAESSSDYIGHKPPEMQQTILAFFQILMAQGIRPTRDDILIPICQNVKENPDITWNDINQIIPAISKKSNKKNKTKKAKTPRNEESTVAKGDRFCDILCDLLNKFGYTSVSKTKYSWDYGGDITGCNLQGEKIVIQARYHQEGDYEYRAIQTAHNAKSNYQADIAIAATNTFFTKNAKKEAERLNVKLWDGSYLREVFSWNGNFDSGK